MKISVLTPSIRPLGLDVVRTGLLTQSLKDFEWLVEVGLKAHDLNAAYNRMLRRAQGELVVSLQDYILIQPDYLQRFWEAHQEHPKIFFTAPVGKVKNFNDEPTWDWRKHTSACKWNEWEIDSGTAPLAALKEIGGFDEVLDGTWSGDNVNVGCRAELAGYEFACIDNPSLAYDHDASIPHPFRDTFNGTLNTKRMAMFRGGMRLPSLH